MIKSLSIRNIATFNNDGININNLKQINIIYGANGSGKSTIGKAIANIESYDQSSISWENERPMEVLAYNKEFCKNNFLEQMPGVFTLGEASTAALAEIERKQEELQKITNNGLNYKSEIDKQEIAIQTENKTFSEFAWNNILKKYERWFSKSTIGAGTKDRFIEKLLTAYQHEHSKPLPIDELKKRASVLLAHQPLRIEPYILIDNNILVSIEVDTIWEKIIIGKQDIDIAKLISELKNSDWVNQGVKYMKDGSDICPFCQQHTITDTFRVKINGFFDEVYKQDISKVNKRFEEYKNAVDILTNSLEHLIETQKKQEKFIVNFTHLDSILFALKATFSQNLELIALKQKEPSRVITLTNTTDIIRSFNAELTKVNDLINEHNYFVDNFTKERSILINEIWKFFASEYDTTIARHIDTINGIKSAIKNLKRKRDETAEKYKTVKKEIVNLENSVTSVTPTINEINRLLKGYGFTNFQIQEVKDNKNHYQIVRENGETAKTTLSEGETTFITFLYYMQLIKGSFHPNGITADRVLVIDDPVSSLDSGVLFVVSTLLRDVFTDIHTRKGAIKQVILLTHNVYFHKEIAFLDKHCKWRNNVKYLVLRKRDNVSSIQDYGEQNPIKSSYELLWTELRSKSQHSCVVIQNIMRRIIENYFLILGGISPEVILEKFNNYEERAVCRSLLSWVNDGSHSLPDDLFVEISDDQLNRNMAVFKDIFYKMGQEAHYEMMMQMKEKEDESCINNV